MQHIHFRNLRALGAAVAIFGFLASSAGAETTAPTVPTTVTASPQPLVFYQATGKFSGSSEAEILNKKMEAHVHDKLLPELTATFGTRIIDVKSADYSQADLAALCRKNGAVGILQFVTAWNVDPAGTTILGAIL